jgi:hypothetical protein
LRLRSPHNLAKAICHYKCWRRLTTTVVFPDYNDAFFSTLFGAASAWLSLRARCAVRQDEAPGRSNLHPLVLAGAGPPQDGGGTSIGRVYEWKKSLKCLSTRSGCSSGSRCPQGSAEPVTLFAALAFQVSSTFQSSPTVPLAPHNASKGAWIFWPAASLALSISRSIPAAAR